LGVFLLRYLLSRSDFFVIFRSGRAPEIHFHTALVSVSVAVQSWSGAVRARDPVKAAVPFSVSFVNPARGVRGAPDFLPCLRFASGSVRNSCC
jgi:hypothetical protein